MTGASSFDPCSAPGLAGRRQRWRRLTQAAFFVLFVLAPPLDLLRFDLTLGHAWLFGQPWRLGIDTVAGGTGNAAALAAVVLTHLVLPVLGVALTFLLIAWRWGRLYCGWLCPHFSVVETINRVMSLASGRQSVWDRSPVPRRHPDGRAVRTDMRWWFATAPLAILFAACWAIVLLTYLLPPQHVYRGLVNVALARNEWLFLGVATTVLSLEFMFARHLFCRFGCAVGLFQSLAWVSNRGALVMGFARDRAADCARCYAAAGPGEPACETVCPMRLKPRVPKAQMFTCTQCGQCNAACATVQRDAPRGPLLRWVDAGEARRSEARVSLTGQHD